MLSLRHHTTRSPFSQSSRRLQLSSVHHEEDELIEAIEKDRANEVWTLDKTPDADGLAQFWTSVEQDLKNDPEWFDFAKD